MQGVEVLYLDMAWFYRDRKNFQSFVTLLWGRPRSVYSSDFVQFLLALNWKSHQRILIVKYFSFYIIYVFCSIIFMRAALTEKNISQSASWSPALWILYVLVMLMWSRLVYLEILQCR